MRVEEVRPVKDVASDEDDGEEDESKLVDEVDCPTLSVTKTHRH